MKISNSTNIPLRAAQKRPVREPCNPEIGSGRMNIGPVFQEPRDGPWEPWERSIGKTGAGPVDLPT